MTPEIGILLGVLAVAVVLFSTEWISADVVGLGILITLVLTGLLTPDEAFAGFGSDTVVMFLGLLILTAALLRTGVVATTGRAILRHGGKDPDRLLVMIVLAVALLSAFISNTAAAAFFLPIAVGIAGRAGVSPSKFLLPLAFGAIVTSSVSLISTSTNIVISGLIQQYGLPPMGMFELAPVGIPISIVGLAYILTLGRRLLPARAEQGAAADAFGLGPYLTEVLVLPGSKLIGKTLAESGLGRDLDLTVLRLLRGKSLDATPDAATRLEPGDVLLVEGKREEILKVKDTAGIEIRPDVTLSDPGVPSTELHLAEAIVPPTSPLIGRSLKGYRFRERHGLQVLAIHRHDQTLYTRLGELWLRLGDVLLLQGSRERIAELQDRRILQVMGSVEDVRPNVRRARLAVTIFVGALVVATFRILPLPVAVLTGAVLAFLTRCITPEEAYREVEWKAVILVASMLALGAAMESTGAARFLAGEAVSLLGTTSPAALLTVFFVLTVALTQPMSNQAAAVVVLPIAIQTALQLGLNPRTFAMMIAVAASCSYLTPLEPACLMVYGPGRYRFTDFVRVGALLTLLIYLVAILLVPRVWPVRG